MRASGILMPMSSLPGSYGIGTMGKEAYRWVDFLADSGQHFWQLLPIGPTGYGDSPYQSVSAFAGNPYFIDPELLVEEGLLTEEETQLFWGDDGTRVDYVALYDNRPKMLAVAVGRIDKSSGSEYDVFCREQGEWLHDFGLFMSIKEEQQMQSVHEWPDELRTRDAAAIAAANERLAARVEYYKAVQYLFDKQWQALKAYAAEKNIKIIGDIPIYVSPDSSDLWARPELFQLDANRRLGKIAGCPPDAFAEDGQMWGNPLYDWDYHKATEYEWWLTRLKHACTIYDVVRIDHFRGLESYYSIPAEAPNAKTGQWCQGPGKDFIRAVKEHLPGTEIIAEDLGFITPEVADLLAFSDYPGMKIIQFAFDSREPGDYMPDNFNTNSVVYTGTHDNITTKGWIDDASEEDVQRARDYAGIGKEADLVIAMIGIAMNSVSDTCIIPMQDWLRLGAEARMNTPSVLGGNWQWRMDEDWYSKALEQEIKTMTENSGRIVTE